VRGTATHTPEAIRNITNIRNDEGNTSPPPRDAERGNPSSRLRGTGKATAREVAENHTTRAARRTETSLAQNPHLDAVCGLTRKSAKGKIRRCNMMNMLKNVNGAVAWTYNAIASDPLVFVGVAVLRVALWATVKTVKFVKTIGSERSVRVC